MLRICMCNDTRRGEKFGRGRAVLQSRHPSKSQPNSGEGQTVEAGRSWHVTRAPRPTPEFLQAAQRPAPTFIQQTANPPHSALPSPTQLSRSHTSRGGRPPPPVRWRPLAPRSSGCFKRGSADPESQVGSSSRLFTSPASLFAHHRHEPGPATGCLHLQAGACWRWRHRQGKESSPACPRPAAHLSACASQNPPSRDTV